MSQILVTWIGKSDLKACKADDRADDCGPVYRLLRQESFDRVELLNDFQGSPGEDAAEPEDYACWLAAARGMSSEAVSLHPAPRNLRNDYAATYAFTEDTIQQLMDGANGEDVLAFLLSPGNPACQVAMLLFARFARREIKLYNTWHGGVEEVRLPFALSGEARPDIEVACQNPVLEWVDHETVLNVRKTVIGESDAIVQQAKLAAGAAKLRIPVVLLGETGTGKEVFAEAIHRASGRPADKFIPVNLAAVPDTLVESELFGHKEGAFTGSTDEREGKLRCADGGTLFLDEIGDLGQAIQVKLLRVLEDRVVCPVGGDPEDEVKVDVRIIAATNRDLKRLVDRGEFREDLYQRLGFLRIHLPPLRERGDDLVCLADEFLKRVGGERGETLFFGEDAKGALLQYKWPGNVRELKQTVEALGWLCRGPEIHRSHVEWALIMASGTRHYPRTSPLLTDLTAEEFLREWAAVTDELIRRANAPPAALPRVQDLREELGDMKIQNAGSIEKRYLLPMLYGRALAVCGAAEWGKQCAAALALGRPHRPKLLTIYERYFQQHLPGSPKGETAP